MSLPNRWPDSRRSRSRKRAISVESATTELTRLPGLEVAETKPELKPEHWIERGPSKRLMLFSGRSHPALAQRIAEKLGIQVGDVSLRTFADGNTYCRYEESIRGADLFIVQTSSPPQSESRLCCRSIPIRVRTRSRGRANRSARSSSRT